MSGDDRDYYRARAEQELERASNAACEEAVRAHYELAALYLDRVYGEAGEARSREAVVPARAFQ